MNMKKIKKFFTLSRHAEGFTLVELIVVIAILAILGGVALPAYSGYIKKAHMAADQTMISDVAKALQLQYYNNPNNGVAAYVVLGNEQSYTIGEEGPVTLSGEAAPANPDAAAAEFADKAMIGVFGENWRTTVLLEHNEWGLDDDMMALVSGYSDAELALIADSTYLTASTPEGLMNAVTDMTGLVSGVIATSDLDLAEQRLTGVFGADSHMVKTITELGLKPTDSEYATVVSNLMVDEMAYIIQDNSIPNLNAIVTEYAAVYNYAAVTGDTEPLDKLNENLNNIDYDTLMGADYATYVFDGVGTEKYEAYNEKVSADDIKADQEALKTMMDAVKLVSGDFTDKESLSNAGLYASDAVAAQVNGYINAVKALAGMSADARKDLETLPDGMVAVFIAADGSVSVIPADAWAA